MPELLPNAALQAFVHDPHDSIAQGALLSELGFASESEPLTAATRWSDREANAFARQLQAAIEQFCTEDEWEAAALALRLELARLVPFDSGSGAWEELARVYEEELFDEPAALATSERALTLFPGSEELARRASRLAARARARAPETMDHTSTPMGGADDSAHALLNAALGRPPALRADGLREALWRLKAAPPNSEPPLRRIRAMARAFAELSQPLECAQVLREHPRGTRFAVRILVKAGRLEEARMQIADARAKAPLSLAEARASLSCLGAAPKAADWLLVATDLQNAAHERDDARLQAWLSAATAAVDELDAAALESALPHVERLAPKHPDSARLRKLLKDRQLVATAFGPPVSPRAAELLAELARGGRDEATLRELEAALRAGGRHNDVRALYQLQMDGANTAKKVDVLSAWADFEEDAVGDAARAIAIHEELLAIVPQRTKTLRALSRLYAATLQGEKAIAVLERDRDGREGEDRAAREIAIARCYLGILVNPEQALHAVRRAAALTPASVDAVRILEELLPHAEVRARAAAELDVLYTGSGERHKRMQVLEIRANTEPSARAAESLYVALAALSQELGLAEEGYRATHRGVREHPNSIALWAHFEQFARGLGKASEFMGLLDAALAQPGLVADDAARVLNQRLASLWSEFGEEGRVVALLQRQLAAAPDDTDLFARLKIELSAREEWTRLSEAYEVALAACSEGRRRELLAEVAILREELAGDAAGAMRAYEQLLALDATNSDAQYALEKLYERAGRDSELAALLAPRAVAEPAVALRLAVLLDANLSRPQDAIPMYVASISVDPEHGKRLFALAESGVNTQAISEALAEYFEQAGDTARHIRAERLRLLPAAQGAATLAPGVVPERTANLIEVHRRIIAIASADAAFVATAFEHQCQLVVLDPADAALRADLIDGASTPPAVQSAVDALVRAEAAAPEAERAAIAFARAQLLEQRSEREGEARQAYARALELAPLGSALRQDAFDALRALLARAGDHLAVGRLLLARAAELPAAEQAELCEQVVDLASSGDAEFADLSLEANRRLLAAEPTHERALSALSHQLDENTCAAELARVLAQYIEVLADPHLAQVLRLRLADLYAGKLGRESDAITEWRLVLSGEERELPHVRGALTTALRHLTRYDEEVVALEEWVAVLPPSAKPRELRARIAAAQRRVAPESPEEVAALEHVVALAPSDTAARGRLTELFAKADVAPAAASVWLESAARAGLAPLPSDNAALTAAWADALILRGTHADDFDLRDRDLRALVQLGDRVAPEVLLRASKSGLVAALQRDAGVEFWARQFVEHRSATPVEAAEKMQTMATEDGSDAARTTVLLASARVLEANGATLAARHALEGALALTHDEALVDHIAALYTQLGDARGLAAHLGAAAAAASDDSQRAARLNARAETLQTLGAESAGDAAESFEQSLDCEWNVDVQARLLALLLQSERFGDAMALIERALAHPDTSSMQKYALYTQLGDVARDHSDDLERALDAYDAGLALSAALSASVPNEDAELLLLQRVCGLVATPIVGERAYDIAEAVLERGKRTQARADLREARLAAADVDERARLLRELAQLYERQLAAPALALGACARELASTGTQDASGDKSAPVVEIDRLAAAYNLQLQRAELYRDYLHSAGVSSELEVELGVQASETLLGAGAQTAATALLNLLWVHDEHRPDSPAARLLERDAAARGAWTELGAHYDVCLEHHPEDHESLVAAARLADGYAADPARARGFWSRALALRPADIQVQNALISTLANAGETAALAALYAQLASEAQGTVQHAEYQVLRGELLAGKLGDPDGAREAYAAALSDEDASDVWRQRAVAGTWSLLDNESVFEQAAALLENVYNAPFEPGALARIAERRLLRAQSAETKAELEERLGELALALPEQMGDVAWRNGKAFVHYQNAVLLSAPHEGLVSALAESGLAANQEGAVVSALEHVTQTADAAVVTHCHRLLAKIHDEVRGDLRAALAAWLAVLAREDDAQDALEAIERFATLLSDWDALELVYAKRVETALSDDDKFSAQRLVAELRRDMKDDVAGAIVAFDAALALKPNSPSVLDALIELREGVRTEGAAAAELDELYTRRLELTGPEDAAVAAHLRGAYAQWLASAQQPGRAIEQYEAQLELLEAADQESERPAVLAQLTRLYSAESRTGDVARTLEVQLARGYGERSLLLGQLGDALRGSEDERDRAVDAYLSALELMPHEPWQRALLGLWDEGNHARIVAALDPQITAQSAPELRLELLAKHLGEALDPEVRGVRLREQALLAERVANLDLARSAWIALFIAQTSEEAASGARRCAGAQRAEVAGALAAHLRAHLQEQAQTGVQTGLEPVVLDVASALADSVAPLAARDLVADAIRYRGENVALLRACADYTRQLESPAQYIDWLQRLVAASAPGAARAAVLVESARAHAALGSGSLARASSAYVAAIAEHAEANGALAELDALCMKVASASPSAAEASEVVHLAAPTLVERGEVLGDWSSVARVHAAVAQVAQHPAARFDARMAQVAVLRGRDAAGALGAAVQAAELRVDSAAGVRLVSELAAVDGTRAELAPALARVDAAIAGQHPAEPHAPDGGAGVQLRRVVAQELVRNGEPRAASALLATLVEVAPLALDLQRDLAQVLRGLGDWPAVVTRLLALAQSPHPQSDAPLAREAAYREAGQVAEYEMADSALALQIADSAASDLAINHLPSAHEFLRLGLRLAEQGTLAIAARLARLADAIEAGAEPRMLRTRAALEFANEGVPARAALLWEQLASEQPLDAAGSAALAIAYRAIGRHVDAVRVLSAAANEATAADARRALRMQLLAGECADTVRKEVLANMLQDAPNDAEVRDQWRALLLRNGDKQGLCDAFEGDANMHRLLGDGAAAATALHRAATLAGELGADAKRIELLVQAHQIAPTDDAIAAELQLRFAQDQQHKQADAVLAARADRAAPELRAERLAELASSRAARGLFAEAAEAAEQLLQVAPGRQAVLYELCTYYEAASNFDGLARTLEIRALAAAPIAPELPAGLSLPPPALGASDRAALWLLAAAAHRDRRGQPKESIRVLELLLAEAPTHRAARLALADSHLAAGSPQLALAALAEVVAAFGARRTKELALVYRKSSGAYRALGDGARALAELDLAFKVDPGNIEVLRDLGLLALEIGDLDKAQKSFRALLLQRLDDGGVISKALVFHHLGQISQAQGDSAKALQMYARALENDPNLAQSRAAIAQLSA